MDKQNYMAMNLSNQEVVKKPGECVTTPFAPAELLGSAPGSHCALHRLRHHQLPSRRASCAGSAAGSLGSSSSWTI